MLLSVAGRGLLAGLAGVAVMTGLEKVEQLLTGRPSSFVPAHTLERLLRLPRKPDQERLWLNWAMHWGQGIFVARGTGAEATAVPPRPRPRVQLCTSWTGASPAGLQRR